MTDRKPSPYATFNVYNGSMGMKETKEAVNTAKPLPQQPIRENFKNQSPQIQIPQIQPRKSQPQNQSQLHLMLTNMQQEKLTFNNLKQLNLTALI